MCISGYLNFRPLYNTSKQYLQFADMANILWVESTPRYLELKIVLHKKMVCFSSH